MHVEGNAQRGREGHIQTARLTGPSFCLATPVEHKAQRLALVPDLLLSFDHPLLLDDQLSFIVDHLLHRHEPVTH